MKFKLSSRRAAVYEMPRSGGLIETVFEFTSDRPAGATTLRLVS